MTRYSHRYRTDAAVVTLDEEGTPWTEMSGAGPTSGPRPFRSPSARRSWSPTALGSRSALEWLIDRYQVTMDTASGIVNDPNDWADEHHDPRYILDLIKRVTTVSVETRRIAKQLPSLDLNNSSENAQ